MLNWKKSALWGLATIVLPLLGPCGKASAAQNGDKATGGANSAASNAWPEVNLNVVVLDKDGAPQKISGSEFRLFEDGVERPLQSLAADVSPVSVAFLIDTSGSMYRQRSTEAEFIKAVAQALPAGSEIAAVEFADQPRFVLPFTPISNADLSLPLESCGSSAMFDAIIATENYFATNAHNQRRALILLSDGTDSASVSQGIKAIRSLHWSGAPTFYSLFIPNQDPNTPKSEDAKGYKTVEAIANAGGGTALAISPKTNIAFAAARFLSMIRSQQVLRFTSSKPARDGKAHKLDLQISNKNLQILALRGFYAPEQISANPAPPHLGQLP